MRRRVPNLMSMRKKGHSEAWFRVPLKGSIGLRASRVPLKEALGFRVWGLGFRVLGS